MKYFFRTVAAVALSFVIIFTPAYAIPKTTNLKNFPVESQKYDDVLTLWHIDSFEGGVGSRGDFLSDVLADYSKNGIHTLVSSYSVEGAKESLKTHTPDMISFGIGCDFVAGVAEKLPYGGFLGGEINGAVYAVPWCRGGYFLISEKGVNRPIEALIVSKGKYNNPLIAAYYSKIEYGKAETAEPLNAYTEYLKGGKVLLGTQRDIWRLTARGKSFVAEPIEDFCDLYQYVAITTTDERKYEKCVSIVEYLTTLGDKVNKTGMFSASGNYYDGELGKYDILKTGYTFSPFLSADIIEAISEENDISKMAEKVGESVKYIK